MRVAVVVAAVTLAGCIFPNSSSLPGPTKTTDTNVWAFRDDLPLEPQSFDIELTDTGWSAAEPMAAIVSDGVLVTGLGCADIPDPAGCRSYPVVLKLDDGATSWRDVGPQVAGLEWPPSTLDPILVKGVSDVIYFANVVPPCGTLSISPDGGSTWQQKVMPCGTPGFNDHPTMTAISQTDLLTCYNQALYASCTRSSDGGRTWDLQDSVPLREDGLAPCTHLTGHLASFEGVVYLPLVDCSSEVSEFRLYMSADLGRTWVEKKPGTDIPVLAGFHDVSVQASSWGTWTSWIDELGRLHAMQLRENEWSAPVAMSPPFLSAVWFNALEQLDDGRLAVAYYGTTWPGGYDSPELARVPSQEEPNGAVWHPFVSVLDPANGVVQTVRLTAEDSPTARGVCGRTQCIPVGDFLGIDSRGNHLWIPFVDACRDACRSNPGAPMGYAHGTLAHVDLGYRAEHQRQYLEP